MSDDLDTQRLRKQCQETYRAAWLRYIALLRAPMGMLGQYVRTQAPAVLEEKARLQKLMDSVQPWCCSDGRPCAEWQAFTKTLPGYAAFWDGAKRIVDQCLAEMRRKNIPAKLRDEASRDPFDWEPDDFSPTEPDSGPKAG